MEGATWRTGSAESTSGDAGLDPHDEPEQSAVGAPRIHGEFLKLGIEITEPTVAKYMLLNRKPPSQTWRTFLDNHITSMVSVDFFTVPTIRFEILYVFLVLRMSADESYTSP
jgi:hypothetical protein